MERRQDFVGEWRHDASARSRSVLPALQAAAEVRVPNHAAADLSAGLGQEEQGGISGDRLWIARRVYVLLVVCLYPLNGGCLVCFIELTKDAPYAKEFVYFHSHYSQKDIEEVKEQLKMLASQSS